MKHKLFTLLVSIFLFTSLIYSQPIPADLATNVSVTTSLEYDVTGLTSGATEVRVRIWKDNLDVATGTFVQQWGTPVTAANVGLSGTLNLTAALDLNTTYYWGVFSTTGSIAGGTADTYALYSFTTITTPLISPANSVTGVSVQPTFEFAYGTTDLQISTKENDFNTPARIVNEGNLIGTTSFTLTEDLANNKTYYWRVKHGGNWYGPYSFATTFATTPLISPINSVTGVSIQPTFEFAYGTANLQISTEEDNFNTPENGGGRIVNEGVSGTSFTLTEDIETLTNNKTYYWRVKNGGSWYGPWYFKTYSNVNITQYNPANGTTVYTPTMTMFSWGIGAWNTVLTFDLQYMKSNDLPTDWSGAEVESDIEDLSATLELDGGSKYYWRLIAKYNDEIVKYSSVKHFTTAGGPVKPIPSYPLGGVDAYTLTPTLYWYTMTSTEELTFNIRYGTDKDNLTSSISNIADIWYEFDDGLLLPGTKYYWQVQSVYDGTPSSWSKFGSFKTKGEGTVYKPIPSYPISNAKLYTLTPTFYWYIGAAWDGVVEYDLHVYKNGDSPDGSNLVTTTTELFYELTDPLDAGENYKWKVRAHYNGIEKWSVQGSFKTEGGDRSRIVLTYPKGNTLISTVTPQFGWYVYGSTLGLDGYQIKYTIFDTGEPYDNDYWDGLAGEAIDGIYETYFTPDEDLDYGAKYIWAVAAFNGSERQTNWAKTKFRTPGNDKAKVLLSAPANKKTTYTLSPTLMWYVTNYASEIDHYRVTWSNAELFNSPETESITTDENMYDLTDLASGSTYYWKVEVSYDGSTYETVGPTWEFSTPSSSGGTVMPLVGSPANGVTISDNSPVLSWYLPTQTSAALSYEVELANNPEFNDASVFNNIPELQAQISGLEEGEYYWRVKSSNGSSESYYSNTGDFKVGDGVTGVEDNEEVPVTYSIDQNYPNPFNPTTAINYALPEASYVTVKIYDMLGREIKALVSNNVKAGRHTITWRGDNNYGESVSSGTYIYRITAGDFVQAKKMILLK